jgi:alkylation response protein AidB-like acyl-CoA dehydrogenase
VTAPSRDEVRAALAAVLRPRDNAAPVTVLGAGNDDLEPGREWLAALAEGGWAIPTWPREYGGRAASREEAGTIARELAAFEQPDLYPYIVGLQIVAPTLVDTATPEQCARWLAPMKTGSEIWCQLFSEPGAGSDLANVGTRAVRDGDSWVVTGQKVWSSRAHYSRRGFLLARSDTTVPKHTGITAFGLDMNSPGVDVRPLRQMNGDAHFSEVFLDDVVVPDADRISDAGAGWAVARTALGYERGAVGAASSGGAMPSDRLLELARARSVDAVARDRAVAVHIEAEVARLTAGRARESARAGRAPGPEGSGAKLRGSALFKATADAALSVLGVEGIASADERAGEWETLFLTAPSISIRGGTDEIQRNIVGERVLGLPPEPRLDVDRPWDEIPHEGLTGRE